MTYSSLSHVWKPRSVGAFPMSIVNYHSCSPSLRLLSDGLLVGIVVVIGADVERLSATGDGALLAKKCPEYSPRREEGDVILTVVRTQRAGVSGGGLGISVPGGIGAPVVMLTAACSGTALR